MQIFQCEMTNSSYRRQDKREDSEFTRKTSKKDEECITCFHFSGPPEWLLLICLDEGDHNREHVKSRQVKSEHMPFALIALKNSNS